MKINQNQPHIVFEIDPQGNLTSEAHNYPNTQGVCQGEQATQAFESALADAKLIPTDSIKRHYKTDSSRRQRVNRQSIQQ